MNSEFPRPRNENSATRMLRVWKTLIDNQPGERPSNAAMGAWRTLARELEKGGRPDWSGVQVEESEFFSWGRANIVDKSAIPAKIRLDAAMRDMREAEKGLRASTESYTAHNLGLLRKQDS